jgi:tetratricopeptide (TPR) repeat protein
VTYQSDQLDRIARLNEGDLAEVPFALLLYALARSRRSAAIQIRRGPLHKEIFLEAGVPVDCRSNLVHETLSRYMVSIGRLADTAAEEAFRESVARSARFGDILIEKGLITAEELMKILQQNLAHKLLDGFSWRDGRFRLTTGTALSDSPLRVNLPQLILIGIARFATQDQIDGSIAPLIGIELAVNPVPPLHVAEARLPAAHRSLLQALRKAPLRIDQLAQISGLPLQELTRHLYALSLIEVVVPADQLPRLAADGPFDQERRAAGGPTAAVATPAEPVAAVPARVPAELRTELMELVLNHRRKDPFELLGLEPDHADTAAHRSFLSFAQKFAPWNFPAELAEQASDVFLAAARAYAQLCEPERLSALIAARTQPTAPPIGTAPQDIFRIDTELLDPEAQFRIGMEQVRAGRYSQALQQLEFAADLDPQNLQYRSELAFCRFLADPENNATKVLEELCVVTRIDSRYGIALYYTGEILRHTGRLHEAEDFLKRAIKPMAPDRRPIEALRALTRELKAQKKRSPPLISRRSHPPRGDS